MLQYHEYAFMPVREHNCKNKPTSRSAKSLFNVTAVEQNTKLSSPHSIASECSRVNRIAKRTQEMVESTINPDDRTCSETVSQFKASSRPFLFRGK